MARAGGERSWSCAAVNRSMTTIGPPHLGQRHRGWVVDAVEGSDSACGGSAWRARKHSGKRAARLRLARKPKLRMRTKPLGSRCSRKRRRNSSSERVITFCSLWSSRVAPAKGDLAVGERDQAMVGDGHAMGVAAQILQHVFGATEGTVSSRPPSLFGRVAAARRRRSWAERAS